jgi:hypothetical protein
LDINVDTIAKAVGQENYVLAKSLNYPIVLAEKIIRVNSGRQETSQIFNAKAYFQFRIGRLCAYYCC